MYPVSDTFKTYIKKESVSYSWHGTIVDADENEYELTTENIVQTSGKITKRCSNDTLAIGKTCASELRLNLFLDVDRYLLYGGVVTLYFTLNMGSDTEDVPMGIFTISECTQSNGQLHIIAYDDMIKFDDTRIAATSLTTIQSPYEWLTQACTACDIVLGSTSADIGALPNGTRSTGFADVVTDVKTWRDVLGYICAYLGSFAYIGRDGKLYLAHYTSNSVDTISPSFRYSSDLSDYRTTYNGIYCIYKNDGVQEYVANLNEDGLVLDLGTNPFLQFTEQTNRAAALQEIIDLWNDVYYVPYKVSMPIVPYYDPGDVLTFTGNQAGEYDLGAITEVVYSIGGQMRVACAGDNPRLSGAQDRFSKTVAGLSADYTNGQQVGGKDFWILHSENTNSISIGSTKTQVSEIEWKQTVDVMRMGLMYTCELNVSATAIVVLEINVDDDEDYTFEITEQKALLGKRQLNSTCGFDVLGKGLHTAKVYITVTDNALKWGELA